MNILDTLVKLRDDIKTWVANNITSLNSKVDTNQSKVDKKLNKLNELVGTTPVSEQISHAVNAQEHFSGDYNDLTNAPDITEDDSGNMIIADESGNIIFKADADGIHTTAVTINGEAAATETYVDNAVANIDIPEVDFTGYATEDFVTSSVESAKTEISESIVSESNEWKIVDNEGNIIFSVDSEGAHTTEFTLNGESAATETYVDEAIANIDFPETDLTGYATETYVAEEIAKIPQTDLTGYATEEYVNNAIDAIPETDLTDYYTKTETDTAINTAKEELSESIVAESDEWKVVDEAGHIIFSVDATGAHTTNLTLNGQDVEDIIDERVASLVDSAPDTLNTLNELAQALGDDPNFATTVATEIGKKVDKVDGKGLSTHDFTDEYKNALDNLGNLAFEESDPTVPDWAKTETKPTYTAEEIGLGNVDNTSDANKPVSTATQNAIESLKSELSESIVSENNEWKVVDGDGNIIFSVNEFGAHTTDLTIDGESINSKLADKVNTSDIFEETSFGWTDFNYTFVKMEGNDWSNVTYEDNYIETSGGHIVIHCAGETLGFTYNTEYANDYWYITVNGVTYTETSGTIPPTYMESDIIIQTDLGEYTFSNMVRRIDKFVRVSTNNDIGDNNSVISDNSFVSGANNIAGGKAFKIIAEPTGTVGGTGTYTLDSVEGIEVGMVYSAVTSIAAYHQGTIQSINSANNTVTVDNYAGYALNNATDDPDNYNFYNTFLLDDHPELGTIDIGANAAAFGQGVNAHNVATHAEGKDTKALGKFSHTEGLETIAGHASHAEGAHTKALGAATHAEGDSTIAEGHYSHSEGHKSQSSGQSAHAEGENTLASGRGAHSEGENTEALGVNTHAEGFTTEASGNYSHSEGYQSKSSGFVSHAEGCRTESSGEYSHSQGNDTIAQGKKSHAEGQNTYAKGENAHAEGLGSNTRSGSVVTAGSTGALGKNSHSEGNTTTASGDDSHAEGWGTTASGMATHAEGVNSRAAGAFSHAEGNASVASGPVSHAEGENTTTKAKCAHSEGRGTIASSENQHVQGKYNTEDTENKYAHIIGGGTSDVNRFNIHTVDWNGNAWFAGGSIKLGGTAVRNYEDAATVATQEYVNEKVALAGGGAVTEGTLVYKGEITDIPTNATKGDVYKLTQNIGNITNISIVENGNILTDLIVNCEFAEDSGESCFYLSLFSPTDYEIPEDIKTLVFNILGTTEFAPDVVEVPNKNIGIIIDGITYNLKTQWCQWIEYVDEGVYARNLAIGGICSELGSNEYLQIVGYNDNDEFTVNYQNVSINVGTIDYRANSYILYNGEEWVEFIGPVEELLNTKANSNLSNVSNEDFKNKIESINLGYLNYKGIFECEQDEYTTLGEYIDGNLYVAKNRFFDAYVGRQIPANALFTYKKSIDDLMIIGIFNNASTSESSNLEEKITNLESRIEQLEAQLADVESQLSEI